MRDSAVTLFGIMVPQSGAPSCDTMMEARTGQATIIVSQLGAPDELPECFVCLNDYTALGVCRALTQAGLKVGDDVLVTGFDDIPYAALLESPLTTIKQPIEEMSKYLIGEVINAIENRTISMNSHTFKAELVVRESA